MGLVPDERLIRSTEDVERHLGRTLLALAAGGSLKAGDGTKLIQEADELRAKVMRNEFRRRLMLALEIGWRELHAARCLGGEASEMWESTAKKHLATIAELSAKCGLEQ